MFVLDHTVYARRSIRHQPSLIRQKRHNCNWQQNCWGIVTPKLFHYYINHSCDPNAIDVTRYATSTQYVALRLIQANKEKAPYDPAT